MLRCVRPILRHSASFCAGLRRLSSTEHEEILGVLREADSTRGGLGGVAPVHLNVDSRIVHGFRWVHNEELLHHEKVRSERSDSLMSYLGSVNAEVSPSLVALVCCSRTNTIIDGHHRATVLDQLGFSMVPVLYVDYGHCDVLVSPSTQNTLTKNDVIQAAQSGEPMEPKSTAHVVRAGDGSFPVSYTHLTLPTKRIV
eukprot:TRINITY_DN15471_c0_g1_i2.p1 TRINITY_DN15471_c0_g1~~TRINITY_DN15471_c0_g1_i2.p1  ORF type:complete len:198 (+),score=46.52 TRINITY_DN15471_c0_g1_i2:253-846(+)